MMYFIGTHRADGLQHGEHTDKYTWMSQLWLNPSKFGVVWGTPDYTELALILS